MRLHLDLRAGSWSGRGWRKTQRQRAVRRFGSTARLTDASRDARGAHLLDVLVQDVRYAARGFRHNPGFAIVVVLTLGLGLGVNAAVFSLLDRLFAAAPAGVVDPGTVRRLYLTSTWLPGTKPTTRDRFNYPELRVMREVAGSGVAFASYVADSARYGDGDAAKYIRVHYTDAVYWPLLACAPRSEGPTIPRRRASRRRRTRVVGDHPGGELGSRATSSAGRSRSAAGRRRSSA